MLHQAASIQTRTFITPFCLVSINPFPSKSDALSNRLEILPLLPRFVIGMVKLPGENAGGVCEIIPRKSSPIQPSVSFLLLCTFLDCKELFPLISHFPSEISSFFGLRIGDVFLQESDGSSTLTLTMGISDISSSLLCVFMRRVVDLRQNE